MIKKITSYLIILITISLTIFSLEGKHGLSNLFGKGTTNYNYCFTVDESNEVYYISVKDNKNYLVAVDSTGMQFLNRDISKNVDINHFVDGIYIDSDRNIIITSYGKSNFPNWINSESIQMFREDGSYMKDIFNKDTNFFKDSRYKKISQITEDSKNLYFGNFDKNYVYTFAYDKSKNDPVNQIGRRDVSNFKNKITSFIILKNGDSVFALNDNTVSVVNDSSSTSYSLGENNVFIKEFFGGNTSFYFRDAISGDVYASGINKIQFSDVMKGSKVIDESENLRFKDLGQVYVADSGGILGANKTANSNQIFVGGATFFPMLFEVSDSKVLDAAQILIIIAIIVGILIATTLIWDFFVSFMEMKLPMLVRQTILIFISLYISLYFLTNFLIVPSITNAMYTTYQEKLNSVGKVFLASLTTVKTKDSHYDYYTWDLGTNLYNENTQGKNTQEGIRLNLVTKDADGQYVVTGSCDLYEYGTPVSVILSGQNPNNLKQISDNFFEFSDTIGQHVGTMISTGRTVNGNPEKLMIIDSSTNLNDRIKEISNKSNIFLVITGILIAVLLTLVELYVVTNVKRLRKNVFDITYGNYEVDIDIHSGDEIEDLADAVGSLEQSIRAKTISLEKLNSVYIPFVPKKFLEMLGEKNIENVTNTLSGYKENICILFVRFNFNIENLNTHETFTEINEIIECTVKAIDENDGTVFNLLFNGFDAVFETNAEDTFKYSIKLQEKINALNKQREEIGKSKVDARIYASIVDIKFGFIGNEKRMVPAAISDIYSELNDVMQVCFGSNIYIATSKTFFDGLKKDTYKHRRVGNIITTSGVKEIYDLYDADPPMIKSVKDLYLDKFEIAVKMFEMEDYVGARNLFMDIISYSSDDGVSRNYMFLSENNIKNEVKEKYYCVFSEAWSIEHKPKK